MFHREIGMSGHNSQGEACSSSASSNRTKAKYDCTVCGGVASKYNFGAITCDACRQFFKRITVGDKYAKLPPCSDGNLCVITDFNRHECAQCRYNECVRSGMRSDLVQRAERQNQFNG